MKALSFVIIAVLLFAAVFNFKGAALDNSSLVLASMLLLLSLFSDLNEFNFWGLRGKLSKPNLEELENKAGISRETSFSPDPGEIQKAQQEAIQLMDSSTGNFLALAFEIEKLLRVAAVVVLEEDVPKGLVKTKVLRERGMLTDDGVKQVDGIRWLRNMLVHGRSNELAEDTINTGIEIAWHFYTELNAWINSYQES